ncbi:class I SAM-dependent methyltransferase [Aurantimonas endophytica]|uniref:class I SAM-dependent methyltransferase n=1 Tax=Aurantimonas endophytica TaxID=1522175 RepID=UPI00300365FF
MSILEFGAFASPTFDPGEGEISYADRLSTAELKQSVSDPEKRDAIVNVDFVITADFESGIDRTFDLVIANHVIEHVPDVIGWLNKIARILNPGGYLFLSVPDKNFTFDIMRDPTLLRELIDSFEVKRKQPSLAAILDARYFRRDINLGSDVWSGKAHRAISKGPSIDVRAMSDVIRRKLSNGEYIDAHCNVFTESSFSAIFKELDVMGIGDLRLTATAPVQRPFNEFYALLQKR